MCKQGQNVIQHFLINIARHSNGQPWPFFKVEPRKYRFSVLNTGISRSYQLYFEPDKTPGTRSAMTVV